MKTAEQFDTEGNAAVAALVDDIREPMRRFYGAITTLTTEMEAAAIPPHLALAILNKMNSGLETAIEALEKELGA